VKTVFNLLFKSASIHKVSLSLVAYQLNSPVISYHRPLVHTSIRKQQSPD